MARIGERVLAFELDDRHVAARVHADQLPAIELAVGDAAPAFLAGAGDDVIVRQRVAGRVVDHAGAAPVAIVAVDGDDGAVDLVDGGDARRLDGFDLGEIVRRDGFGG